MFTTCLQEGGETREAGCYCIQSHSTFRLNFLPVNCFVCIPQVTLYTMVSTWCITTGVGQAQNSCSITLWYVQVMLVSVPLVGNQLIKKPKEIKFDNRQNLE